MLQITGRRWFAALLLLRALFVHEDDLFNSPNTLVHVGGLGPSSSQAPVLRALALREALRVTTFNRWFIASKTARTVDKLETDRHGKPDKGLAVLFRLSALD